MAEEVKSKSHYALKVERQRGGGYRVPSGMTRARRECSFCHRTLSSRKGHGFPTPNGRQIACGACKRP